VCWKIPDAPAGPPQKCLLVFINNNNNRRRVRKEKKAGQPASQPVSHLSGWKMARPKNPSVEISRLLLSFFLSPAAMDGGEKVRRRSANTHQELLSSLRCNKAATSISARLALLLLLLL